ncbi:MAG: hypothetical protein HZC55_21225 [Verrucomicrobia bacterium]|nr:hypothetical protein [Verrucomicrobiota bacterium]
MNLRCLLPHSLRDRAIIAWLAGMGVFAFSCPAVHAAADRVAVWPAAAGAPVSPDYEVTLSRAGETWRPATFWSYSRAVDKTVDPEGKYIKLTFLALHSTEPKAPERNRDTYAHSWTQFDFSGGPVEVTVKIRRPLPGITLPLRSAAVLPSIHGIQARIEGGDTIRFTLARPAKIAVVPNAREALGQLAQQEEKQALEGYRNPLFLFARAPEKDVPAKEAKGTLVIRPGQTVTPAEFSRAKVIWFEPGLHDYSRFPGDEQYYMVLRTGQTVYLAGGAWLLGNFRSEVRRPIEDIPLVRGRGVLSGDKQPWDGVPYVRTVIANVRLDGITVTDPHNHIQHSIAPVRDVAVVGAWHGNTDGLTVEPRPGDRYDGWHIDDCFVMAADTNLKVGGSARARNYVAWQLSNAEPAWIRNPDRCVVDGLYIIAFNNWPPPGAGASRQTFNLHGGRGGVKRTIVRNVVVEAPFVPLLFLLPAEDPGAPQFEDVIFENVVVTTPYISAKSPIGAARADGPATGRIVFRNLVINGVRVTNANCRDYFELLHGVTPGKELVFE